MPRNLQRLWTPCLVGLMAACGASEPQPEPEPNTVWVGLDEPHEETISEALEQTGTADEPGRCSFFWGDVAVRPADARHARFAWQGGDEHIDGYVLCDEERELALSDPRLRSAARLFFQDGRLKMTDPDGVGSTEYQSSLVADRGDAEKPSVAVFEGHTSDETARAAEVLDRLSAVTDDFLFATWPLE